MGRGSSIKYVLGKEGIQWFPFSWGGEGVKKTQSDPLGIFNGKTLSGNSYLVLLKRWPILLYLYEGQVDHVTSSQVWQVWAPHIYIVQTGDLLLPVYTFTITMHGTFMLSMTIKYRYSFMIAMSRQLELNLWYIFLWSLFCLAFIYFQTLVEFEDNGTLTRD